MENDDDDLAWHPLSVRCDWDTVEVHQNRGKIGLAITAHLDTGAELGWSESMNKYRSPQRIINTCLPAHRYNCMLMRCTFATCCWLLNAEYNAMQVRCEDARTRSKVWRKEVWLPSVTVTWNIDEVNLWINMSVSFWKNKEKLFSFSLCSLLFCLEKILWICGACIPVLEETKRLGLWCRWCRFTTVRMFSSFWPADFVWLFVEIQGGKEKAELKP